MARLGRVEGRQVILAFAITYAAALVLVIWSQPE